MNRTLIVMVLMLLTALVNHLQAHGIPSGQQRTPRIAKKMRWSRTSTDDYVYRNRLDNISGAINYSYNQTVRDYIEMYVERSKTSSARIIGRSNMYFSIFEQALAEQNLPLDLKFIPIIESALRPSAVSPAGAVGLWQFMPATAKSYGLEITRQVDERRDPYRSSQAAALFLADLYNTYQDWLLVLAAYNCGPGRVNQAIAAAGSNYVWDVYPFLPKETRGYIPAFISAAYMMNYYYEHDIVPDSPQYDEVMTDTVHIYSSTSLSEVARNASLSLETLRTLNPSYVRDVMPISEKTKFNILTMPVNKIMAYKSLDKVRFPFASSDKTPILYEVQAGDQLQLVAEAFRCSVADLKYWNGITSDAMPQAGTKMFIMLPKDEQPVYAWNTIEPVTSSPTYSTVTSFDHNRSVAYNTPTASTSAETMMSSSSMSPSVSTLPVPKLVKKELEKVQTVYTQVQETADTKRKSPVYHIISAGDNYLHIADRYGISLTELARLNALDLKTPIQNGTRLLVKP